MAGNPDAASVYWLNDLRILMSATIVPVQLTGPAAPGKIGRTLRQSANQADSVSAQDPYLAHQDLIERALTFVCQRHRLRREDCEDFSSAFRLHLMEDDYRIIRLFRGASSMQTYLVTVVTRYYQDWQNARWGKWRVSAEARRLGPIAETLETLLVRDRLTFEEAAGTIRAKHGAEWTSSRLEVLAARFPDRPGRSFVSDDNLSERPASGADPSALVEARELGAAARQARASLNRALDALSPEDRVIMRMHCADEVSLADIARMLQTPQKPLYRRVEKLKAALRLQLEANGLSRPAVDDLIARRAMDAIPADVVEIGK